MNISNQFLMTIFKSISILVLNSTENESAAKITVILEEDVANPIDPKNRNRCSVPDLVENTKQSEVIIPKNERSRSLDPTQHLNEFNALRSRISSIMSLNELSGDMIMNNKRTQNGKW